MNRSSFSRRIGTTASLVVLSILFSTVAQAGHKHRGSQVVPIYTLQQAPVATQYSSAPATIQYFSAPAATQIYSAPTTQVYSAPAAMTYYTTSATGTMTQVGSAPTTQVGSAPVMGAKISAIAREDILSELRQEAKDAGTDGTMRERRKTLRDSARTKYAEELGIDESELSDADTQDIDNVVNSILHRQPGGVTQTGLVQSAPASYMTTYAPAYAPQQPAMIVQPVVPVQFFVPVKQKHHWYHK